MKDDLGGADQGRFEGLDLIARKGEDPVLLVAGPCLRRSLGDRGQPCPGQHDDRAVGGTHPGHGRAEGPHLGGKIVDGANERVVGET